MCSSNTKGRTKTNQHNKKKIHPHKDKTSHRDRENRKPQVSPNTVTKNTLLSVFVGFDWQRSVLVAFSKLWQLVKTGMTIVERANFRHTFFRNLTDAHLHIIPHAHTSLGRRMVPLLLSAQDKKKSVLTMCKIDQTLTRTQVERLWRKKKTIKRTFSPSEYSVVGRSANANQWRNRWWA